MGASGGFVGTAVERVEDLRLLTGKGRYVDDIHIEGMLHAAIVRSAVPHGRIKAVDTEEARRMPGVRAVFTGRDIAREYGGAVPTVPIRLYPIPQMEPFAQGVIAVDKVRYVGEPIAIVVADTPGQAEDAADLVQADIESLPVVADWQTSMKNEVLLFESHGSNVVVTYTGRKGDAPGATGPYSRKEKFSVQRHSAVMLETRGLLAHWQEESGRLTVYGAAKVPFSTRKALAAHLDLAIESIDMIEVDVGGGFGVRGEFYSEDFLVPFASRRLKRPVKWIEDRRENLMASNHARQMDCELEVVCERNGRLIALRGKGYVDAGAYMRTSGAISPRNVAQFIAGGYNIPHVQMEVTICTTNKGPIGTYRGPGRFEPDFFRERMFDMAARDLGIDPVEFRRMNLVRQEQMPFPVPSLDNPAKVDELDNGDYQFTLDTCLREFRWEEKRKLQGKLVDGRYHGIALGCFIQGAAAGPKETARIDIEDDGRLTVYVGSASVGQGLATVLTQIAADTLEVPMDRIRLLHGSTTHLKEGFGSFHDRATVMGGCAVLNTAAALKTKIREAVAAKWGCEADQVRLGRDLAVSGPGGSLGAAELGKMKLRADGEYANHKHTYSYGTAAAHVTVDPGTGRVALLDYFTVTDAGRIINPMTIHGQAVGSVVQGLGGALLENLAYDGDCHFLAGTFADYLLPSAADFPGVRAMVLEHIPSLSNPLGAKGGGEGGIIPTGGVISNAVAAALSSLKIEPKSLPLTPPKVWALIQAARSARQDAPQKETA